MTKHFTVKTKDEAFRIADEYMPFDYELDQTSKAGYPVYRTVRHMWDQPSGDWAYYCYICDLGDRLEVNIVNEKWEPVTVYIHFERELTIEEVDEFLMNDEEFIAEIEDEIKKNAPAYAEYQIADLLSVVNEALYEIDDKINRDLFAEMIGEEVRDRIYGAFGKAYEYLKKYYPESELIEKYNLIESVPAESQESDESGDPGEMYEYQLTVGLFDKDSEKQEISESAARDIIGDVLINQFDLFAFTMIPAAGVYRMNSTGHIVNEPSIRIEIVTDEEINITGITDELKKRLNQESIMVKSGISRITFE